MAQYGTSLREDNQSFQLYSSGRTDEESSNPSPRSGTTTNSPTSPFPLSQHGSRKRESCEGQGRGQSPGPKRSDSLKDHPKSGGKEKRKRSRVTPEQLVHLENYFEMDRSPTAARRKDISEMLGMQERQTQIWFQNRRAKAKLLGGKYGRESVELPPDNPPELSPAFEGDLQELIHEDGPVTIIPCTDLTIGTWRRVATSPRKHDLVAYVSEVKRCLTWFIHSGGHGFKMEIPYDTIINTEFRNASPGTGQAIIALSRPPIFYLESVTFTQCGGTMSKVWKRCSDWTEDHQATRVLYHTIVGSAIQLAHILRNLQGLQPAPLRTSSFVPDASIASPVEIQPPPLASLPGLSFHRSDLSDGYPERRQMDTNRTSISYHTLLRCSSTDNITRSSTSPTTAIPAQTLPHHALPPMNRRTSYHVGYENMHDSREVAVDAPYSVVSPHYYQKVSRNSRDFNQFESNSPSSAVPKMPGHNVSTPSTFPQYHADSDFGPASLQSHHQ
ncbi:homeobox-domain-containing protein [Agrocybe pediades]|nr:homeobox-domain-containing protein [Agrocybe pediades]